MQNRISTKNRAMISLRDVSLEWSGIGRCRIHIKLKQTKHVQ